MMNGMHEMSLALSIVDIAVSRALSEGARSVNRIEIEVGALAGVFIDSLAFCFDAARRDSMAAGAELQIIEIPAQGRCPACKMLHGAGSLLDQCPRCGEYLHIVQGKDLRVLSITVDE